MNWTPELETKAKAGTTRGSNGTSCYFIELTPTMGIKLYVTKAARDAAYVGQSIGAENGIAPQTGECTELRGLDIPRDLAPTWWLESYRNDTPEILYGFLTEIADFENPETEMREMDHEDTGDLREKAIDLGFTQISDLYVPNTGWVNGKPVIVDWDARFLVEGTMTQFEAEDTASYFRNDEYWNKAAA